jgi:hypothetical protein
MLNEVSIDKVYLARGSTDLRKSIDGLAALVSEEFNLLTLILFHQAYLFFVIVGGIS